MCKAVSKWVCCPILEGCSSGTFRTPLLVLCEERSCITLNLCTKSGLHPQSLIISDTYWSAKDLSHSIQNEGVYPWDLEDRLEGLYWADENMHRELVLELTKASFEAELDGYIQEKHGTGQKKIDYDRLCIPLFCRAHELVARAVRALVLEEHSMGKPFEDTGLEVPQDAYRDVGLDQTLRASFLCSIQTPNRPHPLSMLHTSPIAVQLSKACLRNLVPPRREERAVLWNWHSGTTEPWPILRRPYEELPPGPAKCASDDQPCRPSSRGLCSILDKSQYGYLCSIMFVKPSEVPDEYRV